MRVRSPLALGAAAAATVLVLAGSLPAPVSAAVRVHDAVHRTLQQQGRVNIVLTMKEPRPDDILQPVVGQSRETGTSMSSSNLSSTEVQGNGINRMLKTTASTAKPTTTKLKKKHLKGACVDDSAEHETQNSSGDDAASSTATASDADADTDGAHVQALVDRLVQYSKETHREVFAVIKEDAANTSTPTSGKAKSLWITNEVYVRDATPELIEKLKHVPTLGSIREEVVAKLSVRAAAMDEHDFIGEWGLERIQALEAWKLGYLGRNVRVGSIDSGVRGTHEALRDNFVGDYGWFDPLTKSMTPTDPGDHGTAVMGLIAGGKGFGVAPKAQWMSCRACNEEQRCREGELLECAQFMTCPFLGGDKHRTDCSKKPHIINNSWNAERGVDVFENAISVWISAGIIPVFSNGNNGPGCGTVNAPADSTVAITVGATDYDDLLANFSGRGPGLKGEIKPDLTAPGENVVAPGIESDESIAVYSGTSFAAPHVAGAIALLLEAAPGLTTSDIKRLLMQTTDTNSLSTTSQPTCGTLNDVSAFPNNAFGHGRVNILKAITAHKVAALPTTASPSPTAAATASPVSANTTSPAAAATSSTLRPFNSSSSSSGSSSSSSSGSSSNSTAIAPHEVTVGDE